MSETAQQSPEQKRRASDFAPHTLYHCTHEADIRVMQERDRSLQSTLDELLVTNKAILQQIAKIALLEQAQVAHTTDIDRLYEKAETNRKSIDEAQREIDRWENRIYGGWKVVGVAVALLGVMGNWMVSDLKKRAETLEASVSNSQQTMNVLVKDSEDAKRDLRTLNSIKR